MIHNDNHRGSPGWDGKHALFLSMFFVLFLLNVSGAFSVGIAVTAPTTIDEGQSVTVSATGPGTLSILLNSLPVASGAGFASHTMVTNSSSAGLLSYQVSSDSPGALAESRTVAVIDVPLTIQVVSPEQSDLASQTVTFTVTTNLPPELCYLIVDGVSNALVQQTPTRFSKTLQIPEGVHSVQYKCKLNDELPSVSKSIIIDTTSPKITATSPSGEISGSYATLSVDTDEIAKCRYGYQDVAYSLLPNALGTTYALRNTQTLGVDSGGSQTIFVRCEDVHGNAMLSSSIISFLVKVMPTATIHVDAKEPLKAGTYEVSLKTNVPLSSNPTLSYSLQATGKTQQVGLVGEDGVWTGFIIIPEGTSDTVLNFAFEGKSLEGVVGREVVEGKLLKLDAIAPKSVSDFSIVNTSSALRLRWKMPEESSEELTYNIYRSSKEGVTYSDFYVNSRTSSYSDANVDGARYWYYRVAAVDPSGNVGPLSDEIWGSAVDVRIETESEQSIDPFLAARLDEELAVVKSTIIDAQRTIDSLESEPNPFKSRIIDDMNFFNDAQDAKTSLEEVESSLNDFLKSSPTAEEVDQAILESRQVIARAKGLLVNKIFPDQEIETNQPSDISGVEKNLAYALVGKPSLSDKDSYISQTIALQDKLTVSVRASSFKVLFLNGEQVDFTFVKKKVLLDDPINDVDIIEIIPKTVADSVEKISFELQPEVLEDDPVIKYHFSVLQEEEFGYFVRALIPMEEIKKSRTFAYPAVPLIPASSPVAPAATGMVLSSFFSENFFSLDTLIMIFGVIIILGLLGYYMTLGSDPKPFKGLPRESMRMTSQVLAPAPVVSPAPRVVPRTVKIVRSPLPSALSSPLSSSSPLPSSLSVDAKESLSSENIFSALDQAERAIDSLQYRESLSQYRAILQYLKKHDALQHDLATQTMRVYSKLLLYKRLDEATASFEKKDVVALKSSLADVKRLAEEIGSQDIPLLQRASKAYSHLAKSVNALEIEKISHY